jgi:hypothetical protein
MTGQLIRHFFYSSSLCPDTQLTFSSGMAGNELRRLSDNSELLLLARVCLRPRAYFPLQYGYFCFFRESLLYIAAAAASTDVVVVATASTAPASAAPASAAPADNCCSCRRLLLLLWRLLLLMAAASSDGCCSFCGCCSY